MFMNMAYFLLAAVLAVFYGWTMEDPIDLFITLVMYLVAVFLLYKVFFPDRGEV